MAVNSASDRNNQSDEVRRTREAYQKREAEQAKQTSQQVKHINESAQSELETVKGDHQKQMEELKSKTHEAINRRDMQYQKEIGDLRDMHQKQLQRVAADAENKLGRNEAGLKSELSHQQAASTQQRDNMKGNFETEIQEKNKQFEEYATNIREKNQTNTSELKERMVKNQEREVKTVVDDRDERLGDKQRELRDMRKSKDAQIKNLDRQRQTDINRLNQNFESSIGEERQNHASHIEQNREAMHDGLNRTREKFEKAAEDMRAASEASRDELAGTVGHRIGNQVNSLETENRRLKADAVRDYAKHNQEKGRELRNLRDAMTNNIDGLEKNRKETLASVNDRTAKVVADKNKSNDDQLNLTHNFYQRKIASGDLKTDQRLMQVKNDNEKLSNQEKNSNQNRFEKLKGSGEIREGQLRSYFDRASASMKDTFETTLNETRERNQRDQQSLIANFTKQSQESDAKLQARMSTIGNKYESQLAQLKDSHALELKDQQTASNRLMKEYEKKTGQELKTQASQYEYRMVKMQELHDQKHEAQSVKHEETLANLTRNRKT